MVLWCVEFKSSVLNLIITGMPSIL